MVSRVVAVVVVALAAVSLLLWSQWRHEPLKVSGLVETDEIRVGSRVGGRVMKVPTFEGHRVKAGDVLVELEPYDLKERQAQAKADLAKLKAMLEESQHGPRPQEIAAGEARLKFAQAELDLAQSTFNRIKPSFEKNAVSAEEMDQAEKELKAATANLGQRQAELELLKAGTRAEEIAQAQAAVQSAEAALAALDKQIEELTIRAPLDAVGRGQRLRPVAHGKAAPAPPCTPAAGHDDHFAPSVAVRAGKIIPSAPKPTG